MDDTVSTTPQIEDYAKAFLRPRRPSFQAIPGAVPLVVSQTPYDMNAWSLGEGPSVLLVHGWEGATTDMAAFAPGLLAQGLRVVFVELPAHGQSTAHWTSIPHSAAALHRLQRALGGPVHGVIAHSVGGAVTAHALGLGMQAGRAVLIAAPARYVDYAHRFATQLGLDAQGTRQMQEILRNTWQVDVNAVSTPDTVARLPMPALLVHATDDRMVSIRDSEHTASRWTGARLLRVEGVGHRRILSHPPVVDAVVEFMAP